MKNTKNARNINQKSFYRATHRLTWLKQSKFARRKLFWQRMTAMILRFDKILASWSQKTWTKIMSSHSKVLFLQGKMVPSLQKKNWSKRLRISECHNYFQAEASVTVNFKSPAETKKRWTKTKRPITHPTFRQRKSSSLSEEKRNRDQIPWAAPLLQRYLPVSTFRSQKSWFKS